MSVVDVGCGRGEVSKFLTEKGHSVFSIDYSYAACQIFGENCGDNVPFLRHDISTGLPWIKDGYFDVAVMADIIEHLYSEQLEALSVELNRILKSGAIALADTPIMAGGESVMHVDIKDSAAEVMRYFPWARLIGTHWHMKPEHCHFIMEKI